MTYVNEINESGRQWHEASDRRNARYALAGQDPYCTWRRNDTAPKKGNK